jgi:hypothetical protein
MVALLAGSSGFESDRPVPGMPLQVLYRQNVGSLTVLGKPRRSMIPRATVGGDGVTETDLAVGAQAPDFIAPDEQGRDWRLADGLARSAQVLVFYRGDW